MNVFLVKDGGVRGTSLKIFNSVAIHSLTRWKQADKPNRLVYSVNKDVWYQLTPQGYWAALPSKPKVIAMAELIGAIPVFTLKEIQGELSSYSFFEKR